ncbi:YafY family transcriptional regulator [Rhizobium wenxiniae]|uniref:helix-turn-helix transcriptional regulator n=1 Tax=Rhizobium wenxiniae TaxID=1737357 RepID=UPI001C6EC988|nr:YafY family protein [Rhizobium wenxiniae]MBW9090535.1 YafY family transcriptional regulator [Rhizobium wenxiniae]
MSRTGRLFELLSILRARRIPVTALDLADRLGVSERSIYRDIDTLRALGAPIDAQAGVGFCLGDGYFLPEFAFSPDELDAIKLGLSWVQQRGDPALAFGSESALAKILSIGKAASVMSDDASGLITAAPLPEIIDPPHTAALREAIRRQRKAEISYQDAQGCLSDRTIWPIAIVYFDGVRILAAWCERRSAFRHFRIDRLQLRAVLQERYPGRRQSIVKQWHEQDRDWRSLLTVSDK